MKSSRDDALRWLRQAENDLAFARIALREGFYSQTCFLAQQVAGKGMKALLYYRGSRSVTGHSLAALLTELENAHPELSEQAESLTVLDQYYIPTRYPDALPGSAPFEVYGSSQAKVAIETAALVVERAKQVIEGR